MTELVFPDPEGVMAITSENAYFIHPKHSSNYYLYVDGKYLTTLDHIPEEMTDFQIKEQ